MTLPTHVVLGGNGPTGTETIKALLRRGMPIASVGRRPYCPTKDVHSEVADLMNPDDASRVFEGREVAYFTVGLPYSAKIWAAQWPVILGNTIDAAVKHGTHLIYLDNVYAYGEVEAPMTEETPLNPTSKKGQIRADAVRSLEAARDERGLGFTIGRSADFYGPGVTTSMINGFVLDPVAKGKKPTWMINAELPHSLTYTPDIGEALATLGTTAEAQGKTWHLPTAPALTGKEFVALVTGSEEPPKVMSLGTLRFGSIFNRSALETLELAYQFSRPYVFDSSRYEREFAFAPTPIQEGIAATLAATRQQTPDT